MTLSDSQPFSMTESQQQHAGYSQNLASQNTFGDASSQQGYNLSLSQDFVLTSSQEEMYRFGEVWGATPTQ